MVDPDTNFTTNWNIEIIPAKIEQAPVLAQLMELYIYDFTEYWDFDVNDNGCYEYERLPLYWQEPNRFPFLVKINDKLAGFVLLQKGSPIDDRPELMDVAEFFVLKKFRKKGVGQTIALHIWTKFPGQWQVRVLEENTRAKNFWAKVIAKFSNNHFSLEHRKIKQDPWQIYQFSSPPPIK